MACTTLSRPRDLHAIESGAVSATLSKIASERPVYSSILSEYFREPPDYSGYTTEFLKTMVTEGSVCAGIHKFSLEGVGSVTLLNLNQQGIFLLLTHVFTGRDRLVGEGKYKRVKFAVDLETGARLALSIVRDKPYPDGGPEETGNWPEKKQQIFTEIELQNLCQGSPYVLPISGVWEDTERKKIYILTPFCSGGSLSPPRGNTFESLRRIPVQNLIQLTLDTLQGLRHIHRQGVCHRDLHVANIFNNDGRAEIADFGRAERTSDPSVQYADRQSLEVSFHHLTRRAMPSSKDNPSGATPPAITILAGIIQSVTGDARNGDEGLLTEIIDRIKMSFADWHLQE